MGSQIARSEVFITTPGDVEEMMRRDFGLVVDGVEIAEPFLETRPYFIDLQAGEIIHLKIIRIQPLDSFSGLVQAYFADFFQQVTDNSKIQ